MGESPIGRPWSWSPQSAARSTGIPRSDRVDMLSSSPMQKCPPIDVTAAICAPAGSQSTNQPGKDLRLPSCRPIREVLRQVTHQPQRRRALRVSVFLRRPD